MLDAKSLKSLKVGDEIDSGAMLFEGLPDEEFVTFTVVRVGSKVVEFELTYFSIVIGSWVAKPTGTGAVLWIDQTASRNARKKKKGAPCG